ncbi:hypothetical protein EIN_056430 [Entamoeba invadens IP1]|uniref:hypothetical protein n=1 Tax=Entamoeba invadens IP1 TaxID=370355 RepID=UPI0002C3E8DB|nr:hypothetical protein EIN_056430 [Entamoeba invadens IP1]ELP93268.1 hypothetical protein EIN_056430 [Entamoeba invadens IP1]|eukprot:XP_004260039.1 hypothetical protein EIN_056430 [Entamoeba invadens IP1]
MLSLFHTQKVFGVSIEKIRSIYLENDIPRFLTECATFILQNETTGIFRIPGDIKKVQSYKKKADKCVSLELLFEPKHVHTVTSLMTQFLKDLPDPIIPRELYPKFLACASTYYSEKFTNQNALAVAANTFHFLLLSMPPKNLKVLAFYMNFFYNLTINNQSVHKMNSVNLSTCVAPNVLRGDNVTKYEEIHLQVLTGTFFIEYYPLLFRDTCLTNGLLFPQYQNVSFDSKNIELQKLTKSVVLTPRNRPQKKVTESIWKGFNVKLQKEQEIDELFQWRKTAQNQCEKLSKSTIDLYHNQNELESHLVRSFLRPKSESIATTLIEIQKEDINLPKIDTTTLFMNKEKKKKLSFDIPLKKMHRKCTISNY